MSYRVDMSAKEVSVTIPLSDIDWLTSKFWNVNFEQVDHQVIVTLDRAWEEDRDGITGTLNSCGIVLDAQQSGGFKNSSDGGLGILLERYKGCAYVEETGEDGEYEVYKYDNGIRKDGKVTFD